MKNLYIVGLLIVILTSSCEKSNDSSEEIEKLIVKFDKGKIKNDGIETTTITVIDNNGTDVTNLVDIYANENKLENSKFSSPEKGVYNIVARKDKTESETKKLVVTKQYDKNSIIQDYTATWCGWCPIIIEIIDKFKNDPSIIPIAIHVNDIMAFSNIETLTSKYNITGLPTALVNIKDNLPQNGNTTVLDNKISNIATEIKASVENKVVKVDVKIKIGDLIEGKLKIAVCLLENGIKANQSNYLSNNTGFSNSEYFKLPEIITGFIHNHVLRKYATSILGDEIPAENVINMIDYEKTYNIDISAYNAENCEVVAYIILEDSSGNEEILNGSKVHL